MNGTDGKMKNLYFRGRRIIDESLKALSTQFGLAEADNVLLTGCSAGGLATYLHTDYVQTQLESKWAKSMTKYKASSISGFFLQHVTTLRASRCTRRRWKTSLTSQTRRTG